MFFIVAESNFLGGVGESNHYQRALTLTVHKDKVTRIKE